MKIWNKKPERAKDKLKEGQIDQTERGGEPPRSFDRKFSYNVVFFVVYVYKSEANNRRRQESKLVFNDYGKVKETKRVNEHVLISREQLPDKLLPS